MTKADEIRRLKESSPVLRNVSDDVLEKRLAQLKSNQSGKMQMHYAKGTLGGQEVNLNYDPNQPRDPKGSSTGGQWTKEGGVTQSAFDNKVDEIEKRGRTAVIRYSQNIEGDIERGWSAWMGQRWNSKEGAVSFVYDGMSDNQKREIFGVKPDEYGYFPSLDDIFESDDAYSVGEYDKFISDKLDKLVDEGILGYDKHSNEWAWIHEKGGLSSYLASGKDISRYVNALPTGEGVQIQGNIKIEMDLGNYWYLLSGDDYMSEL